MKEYKFQNELFNELKMTLKKDASLVHELAALLDLSTDSVYRRLRGETSLSLDEAMKISHQYQIGLDRLVGTESGEAFHQNVVFSFQSQMYEKMNINLHLDAIYQDLKSANNFKQTKMFVSAVDIPIYYYFNYKNLLKFKLLYWDNSFLNDASYETLEEQTIPEKITELGQQIYQTYRQIPSCEVWTVNTINSTLEHIEFCVESEMISDEWANELYNEVLALIEGLNDQAKDCVKAPNVPFELYLSEVSLGNNVTLAKLDELKVAFLSVNTMGVLKTTQTEMVTQVEDWLNCIIQKSSFISGASEKQRRQFFKALKKRVVVYKDQLL